MQSGSSAEHLPLSTIQETHNPVKSTSVKKDWSQPLQSFIFGSVTGLWDLSALQQSCLERRRQKEAHQTPSRVQNRAGSGGRRRSRDGRGMQSDLERMQQRQTCRGWRNKAFKHNLEELFQNQDLFVIFLLTLTSSDILNFLITLREDNKYILFIDYKS